MGPTHSSRSFSHAHPAPGTWPLRRPWPKSLCAATNPSPRPTQVHFLHVASPASPSSRGLLPEHVRILSSAQDEPAWNSAGAGGRGEGKSHREPEARSENLYAMAPYWGRTQNESNHRFPLQQQNTLPFPVKHSAVPLVEHQIKGVCVIIYVCVYIYVYICIFKKHV